MELSDTLNTEPMVKQKLKSLVHCVTYLHTFMHAEPVDLLFSLFRILSNTLAFTVPHAANTINTILQTLFILKHIIILIKVLERPKIMGKS